MSTWLHSLEDAAEYNLPVSARIDIGIGKRPSLKMEARTILKFWNHQELVGKTVASHIAGRSTCMGQHAAQLLVYFLRKFTGSQQNVRYHTKIGPPEFLSEIDPRGLAQREGEDAVLK